jgi:hypothetical protein
MELRKQVFLSLKLTCLVVYLFNELQQANLSVFVMHAAAAGYIVVLLHFFVQQQYYFNSSTY